MEVEFFSGPNLVNYQYTVACFPLDSITCSGVIGGGILPIDSVSGSLPRGYSRVLANMTVRDLYESMTIADSLPLPFLGSYCAVSGSPCLTVPLSSSVSCPISLSATLRIIPQIPDNTDVDCFITVGGGPLDVVTKCQLAGEATTDPGPVRGCCSRRMMHLNRVSRFFSYIRFVGSHWVHRHCRQRGGKP